MLIKYRPTKGLLVHHVGFLWVVNGTLIRLSEHCKIRIKKNYIQVLGKCQHINFTVRNFVSNLKYLFYELSATLKPLQQQLQFHFKKTRKIKYKIINFLKA
jgi:hypothetical protein